MTTRFISALSTASLVWLCAFTVHAADNVKTNSPLDGSWRWEFTMPDGGKITPTLRVKTNEKGKLTGISRFRSGSSLPVTNFVLRGNEVSFEVVRQRDGEATVTRYSGVQDGDKITGRMVSNWNGQQETYPWEAIRVSDIEGTWKWRFAGRGGGGRPIDLSLVLKRDGDKLSGKLNFGGRDTDIHHGRFRTNMVSFYTVRDRDGEKSTNRYWGTFSGDTIVGFSTSNFGERRTNEWRAVRAD
jgi:hypothetical protein